jgi:hypothetical protein
VQFRRSDASLVGRVNTPERGQVARIEALAAERDAIHARRGVFGEASALDGAGVGLERDLRLGCDAHGATNALQDAADRVGRK